MSPANSLDGLNHLLTAPDKESILKCTNLVFATRHDDPADILAYIASLLGLSSIGDAEELRNALLLCIQTVLASNDIQSLKELYDEKGGNVHAKLKSMLGQIIAAKLEDWTECAIQNRVSLPQLIDVNWCLHIQKSSKQVRHLRQPSLLVEMTVDAIEPSDRKVHFELTSSTLNTMLDGLGKIRDQLNTMT